jgi:hypothetical protein
MPLPMMTGSDESLMSGPGMQGAASSPTPDSGSHDVTPQDQAKGAVEILSKLRAANMSQIEAIATQFPAVSKSAKDLFGAFDKGLQGLIKDIVRTTQEQSTAQPRVAR